jgi:hypothetical protein
VHFQIDPKNRSEDPVGLFMWEPFIEDVAAELAGMQQPAGGSLAETVAALTKQVEILNAASAQLQAENGQLREVLKQ